MSLPLERGSLDKSGTDTRNEAETATQLYRCELLGLDAPVVSELYAGSKFDFHFMEVNPSWAEPNLHAEKREVG